MDNEYIILRHKGNALCGRTRDRDNKTASSQLRPQSNRNIAALKHKLISLPAFNCYQIIARRRRKERVTQTSSPNVSYEISRTQTERAVGSDHSTAQLDLPKMKQSNVADVISHRVGASLRVDPMSSSASDSL